MSMSLDGFIAGPDDVDGNPFGDGGIRLHRWRGRRLFEGLGPDHTDLRAVRTLEAAECLHLRYAVERA